MASIIRIKRSEVAGNPAVLADGELAYSALSDNSSNGGDRLYIGIGTEISGDAANHVVIGGKFFTDKLDHTPGILTANSALIVDADSKLDRLNVDNLRLDGNTLSSTNTNGDINITPNGSGKTFITNLYIGSDPLSEYIFDTIGGAITAGTGITVLNSDIDNTSIVSISNTGVISGSYGSATAIPVLSINAQGQITAASTASISTALSIAGNSGTDSVELATDTLTFTGIAPIGAAVTNNTVTISAADASTTVKGVASFNSDDFTVSSGIVAIKTGGVSNNQLVNSSVTIGSTNVALGSTVTAFTGLTDLTVDTINIDDSTISAVGVAENLSITLTPKGTGTVDVSNARITSLAEPTQASDAATKQYVDAVAEGLHIHQAVDAATTDTLAELSGGTVTYNNGTNGVGATLTLQNSLTTLDGYTLVNGDRILVKNEINLAHNGIYDRTSTTVLTRSSDYDTDEEIAGGDFVFVTNGTLYNSTGWVQIDPVNIIGTDSIVWDQFSGAGTFLPGDGLSLIGSEFNVNLVSAGGLEFSGSNAIQLKSTVAGGGLTLTEGVIDVVGTADRISISTNSIDIASNYVGQTSITTLGTIGTGTWNATTIDSTKGGTGLTSYTTGDLLYASDTNTLAKLPIASSGKVLQVNDIGRPVWGDIDGGFIALRAPWIDSFILEDGSNLLTESGGYILLEE
jgi:hypothetical protein